MNAGALQKRLPMPKHATSGCNWPTSGCIWFCMPTVVCVAHGRGASATRASATPERLKVKTEKGGASRSAFSFGPRGLSADDDGDADEGGDQAILDRRHARLLLGEPGKQ